MTHLETTISVVVAPSCLDNSWRIPIGAEYPSQDSAFFRALTSYGLPAKPRKCAFGRAEAVQRLNQLSRCEIRGPGNTGAPVNQETRIVRKADGSRNDGQWLKGHGRAMNVGK